ncbi:hypothetical protein GCM10010170_027830 [Dactylosporangium salmoneum]|uniref:Uncharacterized protein n=1 Tax=Dactylosporangium salmoneum TaxID=53361 RepID=A0ABN3G3X0_9ACTN
MGRFAGSRRVAAGARYLVTEVCEVARGGFYRALGDIKRLVWRSARTAASFAPAPRSGLTPRAGGLARAAVSGR